MATDDEEDLVDGYFGLESLKRTSQFVTLWWALWSLYDFYLTPYSPIPELSILNCAALYAWQQDQKRRDGTRERAAKSASAPPPTSEVLPTVWPCTSDGCSAED